MATTLLTNLSCKYLKQFFLFLIWISSFSIALAQNWTYPGTQTIGVGTASGGSDLAIAPDGTPYVVFSNLNASNKIKVVKYMGNDWVALPDLSPANSGEPSIEVSSAGIPYVAYLESSRPTVKKFDGSDWITVGTPAFSDNTVSNLQLELSPDGVPYVAYKDNSAGGKVTVMKLSGSVWTVVGVKGFSSTQVKNLSFVISNDGIPHLAYIGQSDKITLLNYTNSQWSPVGLTDFSSSASSVSLDIDAQGKPYIAFADVQNGEKAVVMNLTGGIWSTVGTSGFTSDQVRFMQIKVRHSTPYVVYGNRIGNSEITVRKFVNSEWVKVGSNTITGDNYPHLQFFPNSLTQDILYLAFGSGTLSSPMIFVGTMGLCATPAPVDATTISNQTTCAGSFVTLSATAGTNQTIGWYDQSDIELGEGNELHTPKLYSNAVFYARATGICGSSELTPIHVTVKPGPDIEIAGNDSVCKDATFSLTASGANSYVWKDGPSTESFSTSLTATSTFSVTGTGLNGCSNSATKTVIMNPLPVVTISGALELCKGQSITLTAKGAATYAWSDGQTLSSNEISPLVTTSYSVTGTEANNCKATASIEVIVKQGPDIAISGEDAICKGSTITLKASGAESYVWKDGPSDESLSASLTETKTFTVTGTGLNGCSNSASKTVTANPLPAVTISGPLELCKGQSTTLIAKGAKTYLWDGGQTSSSIEISPLVSTTYSVTGTDANNCKATATADILVKSINLNVSGNNMTFTAEAGSAIYQWVSCESNIFIPGATNKSFTPTQSGRYAVIISQNFCQSKSDCIEVVITGLESEKNFGFAVYPNPAANGKVKATSQVKGKLTVRTNSGQFLFELELNGENDYARQIELKESGIYYFTFTDQSNIHSHKKVVVVN